MPIILKSLRRLAFTAGVVILPSVAALAQLAPQIAVPTPPGGDGPTANIEGCYSVSQSLYGPYFLGFCLNRWGGGSYQVTGSLYCNGRVDWQREWNGSIQINVHHTSCGRGIDWSADTMVCSVSSPQWPLQQPHPGPWRNQPQIAVPTPAPGQSTMTCTYYPGVRGYYPMPITAQRTR
ncbi:MAG: hypothetical protein ACTSWI_02245 [Alphaproteobacteria bacterium]